MECTWKEPLKKSPTSLVRFSFTPTHAHTHSLSVCLSHTLLSDLVYLDAVSANRALEDTHFNKFHKYRMEWQAGKQGYLSWFLDDELVFRIDAQALNLTGALIPEEPMYLIFNTAVSKTWGFPMPCPLGCPCDCFDCRKDECLCALPPRMANNFPAHFLIDYVRVYQNKK
jgi:beta-glucan synthesis-associated protein KRE6